MSGETPNSPPNLKAPDQSGGGQPPPVNTVPPDQAQLAQAIQKMPANFLQMAFAATPMANPLLAKIEPQHITQILGLASDQGERTFNENRRNHLYVFISFLMVVALIVLVIVLFKDKPEVLAPVLTGLVGLGSGFAAGFGVGRQTK